MDQPLCLTFVRTRGWEARDREDDALTDYAALVDWAAASGAVPRDLAETLRSAGEADAGGGGAVLERARALRAVLYGVLRSAAEGRAPPASELAELNSWAAAASSERRLEPTESGGFRWVWADTASLERVLWPVVVSAVELLLSEDVARLKLCAADDCGWLFVDRSRNRSRRWCDMADCGNLAKVRRYRARRG